jgi:predicted phosphodiesterase
MNSKKTDIVSDYIRKFPELPNKMLAELIFTREEGLFNNRETTRSCVRYLKGASGDDNRKSATNAGHFVEPTLSTIKEGLHKLGVISKSEAPEHLQLGKGRYLILSDIHIPFQDDDALACAIEWGLKNNVTSVILNGDIMDTYGVSRYPKEIKRPTISEELEMTRNFFTYLRGLFIDQPIYYKLGNHEERMRAFVLRNARELADLDDVSLEALLKLEEFEIQVVGREMIKIGKLIVLHGHELGESVFSPVNPARGMFLKAKASILFGHNHQVSHHSESNLHSEQVGVWSTGCLCELTPEYRPYGYTKWSHGFACVDVNEDGTFHVNNMKIVKGKIL